jgi:SAM-dependent methyltransferase
MVEAHWTEILFLRHPEIFLAVHEAAWPAGEDQSNDLKAIFDRFGVPRDGRILDVPCGIGRHATRLAKMGYETMGVDLSPAFVVRAKERAAQEGVGGRASFTTGDLRRLTQAVPSGARGFDAAVNLWTSLGYYGEETDVQILREYAHLVRAGGIFVLCIVNRDYVVREFEGQTYETYGDIVNIQEARLDLETSWMRNEWRFYRRAGEDLDHIATLPVEHRIYSLHELRSLFERAGWTPEATFGGWKMEPPSMDHSTLTVVGRR